MNRDTNRISRFFPQTQKGADILANSLNTTVYMPHFFEPDQPFPIEKFPPKTQEQKQELQNFFATVASPSKNTEKLLTFGKELKSAGARKVGVYGFCWGEFGRRAHAIAVLDTWTTLGGKVTVAAAGENTPFSASSIVHPAYIARLKVWKHASQTCIGCYP